MAVGTKFGPPGPSWALLGPLGTQNGHFGPKVALLGPLVAQKKADTRPKCVVTMSLIQAEQLVAVGTKFGPPGPSWDPWAPKRDILGQNFNLATLKNF